jgi:hypothetical protein
MYLSGDPLQHLHPTNNLELLSIQEKSLEVATACTSGECLEHTMSTMRIVTKIYTMNKVLNINERATSKRDSEWMGGEERKWVLRWQVLERCCAGEGLKSKV